MNSGGTVIGKGICIRGQVTGAEDLFLDGVIEGDITLGDTRLTIGPNGLAKADVASGDMVVFGRVEGSIELRGRAELKHSATFLGDLKAARLSIEDGASFQGYVDLTQAQAAAKPVSSIKLAEEPEYEPEAVEAEYSHAV